MDPLPPLQLNSQTCSKRHAWGAWGALFQLEGDSSTRDPRDTVLYCDLIERVPILRYLVKPQQRFKESQLSSASALCCYAMVQLRSFIPSILWLDPTGLWALTWPPGLRCTTKRSPSVNPPGSEIIQHHFYFLFLRADATPGATLWIVQR